MKMQNRAALGLLLFLAVLLLGASAFAEEGNRYEQAVPFGIAHSLDGSSISVYRKPGSTSADASIDDYTLCSVITSEKLSGTVWYHVSYFDGSRHERTGYVREYDFYQLTVAGLLSAASDPAIVQSLQMFSGVSDGAVFVADSSSAALSRSVPSEPEPTFVPAEAPQTEEKEIAYVLNKSRKTFHIPSCSSVNDIKPENREDFYGTREEVISMGYRPCGRCKP